MHVRPKANKRSANKTMGLRLEDIDLIFRESPSVMKTVAYARNRVSSTDEEVLEKDKHEHKEIA